MRSPSASRVTGSISRLPIWPRDPPVVMSSDDSLFLEVAAGLGERISKSAIWFDSRCNWVAALPRENSRGSLTSGGAWCRPLWGDERRSAVPRRSRHEARRRPPTCDRTRAIRHALDHVERIDSELRDGLYLGPIGVAYAAARVADLLDHEEVTASARVLLRAWHREGTRSASADVMSGCAGAVAGLVALTEPLQEPWLVDAAAGLGEELIARAEVTSAGRSLAAPGRRSMHNLCGFSHGAAGIGHAFAELFGVTGEARFGEAAERAFDHERSWFDSRTGTWPDLRDVARRAGRDAPVPTADSWCNGTSGIALSRLRAADLLGTAALYRDADLALATCGRHVSEPGARPDRLLALSRRCGHRRRAHLRGGRSKGQHAGLAAEVGLCGIEFHHGPGAAGFPCGILQGETPGLLLGLAGIGMFYLRLLDRGVPSPLLVHRNGT